MTLRPSLLGAAAILALAAAAPATAAPVQVYGGHTAQDAPIALRVAGSGRALTQLLVHVRAPCADGNAATGPAPPRSRPSRRPRSTSARTSSRPHGFAPRRIPRHRVARTAYGDKLGTATQTIRGTIRRGAAHGTFAATIEIVDPATGAKVTSCRSGTLRWSARSAPAASTRA